MWELIFDIRAKNRAEGWAVVPKLAFVGLDGGHVDVDWQTFEVDETAEVDSRGTVIMRGKPRGRVLTTTVRATSVRELPIPASESAIDVRLPHTDVAPLASTVSEPDE